MTMRFLLATVSLIALPFAVLTGSTPAQAQNTCGLFDVPCQASRLKYYISHGGKTDPPPEQKFIPVPIIVPTTGDLTGATEIIKRFAVAGNVSISEAKIQEAMALVAQGGGNLVAAGGGNLISHDGGSIVAQGGGNLVGTSGGTYTMTMIAANALAIVTGGALKSEISNALISQDGGGLKARAADVQTKAVNEFFNKGLITDTMLTKMTSLAAKGDSVISQDGGGFKLSKDAAAIVAQGGGNLVSDHGLGLVSNGSGTLVSNGSGTLVSNGSGTLVSNGSGTLVGGSVIANDGATLLAGLSSLVKKAGGAIVTAAGGNLITQDGGSIVSQGGGNIVSQGGGNYSLKSVDDKGGKIDAVIDAALGRPPAGLVPGKLALVAAPPPSAAQMAAQSAMTDLQTASSAAIVAAAGVTTATDLVNKLKTALALAAKNNDQQQMLLLGGPNMDGKPGPDGKGGGQLGIATTNLTASNKKFDDVGETLKKSTGTAIANVTDPKDVAAAMKLAGDTGTALLDSQTKNDTANKTTQANVAAMAPPTGPSDLQKATASAAAANAATAAAAASAAQAGIAGLVGSLSHPTDIQAAFDVNTKRDAAGILDAQSKLADAQSREVTASANKDSPSNIATLHAAVDTAQARVAMLIATQDLQVNNKYTLRDAAETDLTNAKAVVAGLTKAYGSNRPADAAQNANITAAMVVQALAQDKFDKSAADARIAALASNASSSGAAPAAVAELKDAQYWVKAASDSVALANQGKLGPNYTDLTKFKSDAVAGLANAQTREVNALVALQPSLKDAIKVQADISAAKQNDMVGILKVNPQVLAAASASGGTDAALVANAINKVVTTASGQTAAAYNAAQAAAQNANAAVGLISKDGGTMTPQQMAAFNAARSSSGGQTDTTTLIATLKAAGGGFLKAASTPTKDASFGIGTATATSNMGGPVTNSRAPGQPDVGTAPTNPIKTMFAGQPGLYEKIIAMNLSPAAMKQLNDVAQNKGTMGGAAGVEISNAMMKANTELAAQPAINLGATQNGAGAAAPVIDAPIKLSPDQNRIIQTTLSSIKPGDLNPADKATFDKVNTIVAKAASQGGTVSLEDQAFLGKNLAALGRKSTGVVATAPGSAPAATQVATAPATSTSPVGGPAVSPRIVGTGPVMHCMAIGCEGGGGLTLDPKLIPKLQKALLNVPGTQTPDQNLMLAEFARILDAAKKGPLTGKDAESFLEVVPKFKAIHPKADQTLGLTALVAKTVAAPTAVASPGGNAVPGSKDALIQPEQSIRGKDGGAKKLDFLPPQATIVPAAGKSDEQSRQLLPVQKLEAKKTDEAIVKPAGAGGHTAAADVADKAKMRETPKQAIVPDKSMTKSAIVEPPHVHPKVQQPVIPVTPARTAAPASTAGQPKPVIPVAAMPAPKR